MRIFVVLGFWLVLVGAFPGKGEGERVTIAAVGEAPVSLVLTDGRRVRLIGIEGVDSETLQETVGAEGALYPGALSQNRYGQILAHIVLPDGTWLQEKLVREGKAIAMPSYETRMEYLAPLLAAERLARAAKAGMWGHSREAIVCADDAKRAFDRFAVLQGRILVAANVRGTTYLNFGEDYRKDFTIKISSKTLKTLPETFRRLTEEASLARLVEVRGYVFYSGGPMIEVTSPAQISLLEKGSRDLEETCQ